MQQFFEQIYQYLNPSKNPDLSAASEQWEAQLPTLWLLGKTGAGKSSLIESVTGNSAIEIGNGFQPCTQTSVAYAFPQDNPIIRFLDTRGLAEASYDPAEDIAACLSQSHALIVVMKAEEPEQGDVLRALEKIRKDARIQSLLLVHTGCLSIPQRDQRQQAIAHNQAQVTAVWGKSFTSVEVDFAVFESSDSTGSQTPHGWSALTAQLAELMPVLYLLRQEQQHKDAEHRNFATLQREVLWYAGTAGASDALPAVGLVSVPAIQGKMLHSLGGHYGVTWTRQRFVEFIGLLGGTFALKYLTKLGVRQIVKLVPVYGQTVGSAVAVAVSFAMTYAIGRAACKYLYHLSKGESVTAQDVKSVFEEALKQVKASGVNGLRDKAGDHNEKNKK